MTNRIILVLFLLNLVQLGYAQKKVRPSLAKGTFSRQIAYGMLNGSIVGGTTLLFGSALSFEAAEKLPFWVGATLGTSTTISWYLTGTEGCCRGIFKAYNDAGNDLNYQGYRWLTRLAVGLSTPVMLTGIVVGLSSELIGPSEGLDPKIGIPIALSSLAIPSVLGSLTYNMTRKSRGPKIATINSNRNAIYFELGGNALNSSLNYEYFIKPDLLKFPSIEIARSCLESGGTASSLLNAANEEAVKAFLDKEICFTQIVEIISFVMDTIPIKTVKELENIFQADTLARKSALTRIHQLRS